MKPLSWYLDSGCSRHLTEEEYMFQDLKPKKGGWITFGGRVGKHPFPSIDNVLYVKGLKHNLLSISQLCDSKYVVSFNKGECINNTYKIDLTDLTNQNVTCLVFINDYHWTVHKKLGHARPTKIVSLGGKHYGLVIVDDYSRWTRVMFLGHKDESFKVFFIFFKHIQNEKISLVGKGKSSH
ncbi:hypothetical protein CR513_31954, partial [Mucuna pruriens]